MRKNIEIELLAPAKNLEYGIAAINCGADALYIGAELFGARYSAGNSVEDIEKLVSYAHIFGVKVFVTMNTILFESELEEAKKLALRIAETGADALIVQDMAFMMFDLPISLHASTQCAVNSVERAKFLEDVGFDRVILERALSLDQIREIADNTTVPLETFVHGAICVSYSGECLMGQVVSGRSGNRGVCSQPCRSEYNLLNPNGDLLMRSKHLLSLKDMNLSPSLSELIELGVSSFKIEGRLKDIVYLKNTVSHYRKKLDEIILSSNRSLVRSSVGESTVSFVSDLAKSFTRGFTDYYINGATVGAASFHTAKAVGERIGVVDRVFQDYFTINTPITLNNGDGICFVTQSGEFKGTNINTVVDDRVYPNRIDGIASSMEIFRNSDIKYTAMVESAKADRKIDAEILLEFLDDYIKIVAKDETDVAVEVVRAGSYDKATNIESAEKRFIEQLSKSGDTPFRIKNITISGEIGFLAVSEINALRRELLEQLTYKRVSLYCKAQPSVRKIGSFGEGKVTYKLAVSNSLSKSFYKYCGFSDVEYALEASSLSPIGLEVMRMKYCIRREIGRCLKHDKVREKLFLENNGSVFELKFDCVACEMSLIYSGINERSLKSNLL